MGFLPVMGVLSLRVISHRRLREGPKRLDVARAFNKSSEFDPVEDDLSLCLLVLSGTFSDVYILSHSPRVCVLW